MYIIQKFSDTWSLLNIENGTSRQFDKTEIEFLQKMFPSLFADKVLTYVEIQSIPPHKLMKLNNLDLKKNSQKSTGPAGKNIPGNQAAGIKPVAGE